MTLAPTIDEGILLLDQIISNETMAHSILSYFPMLYNKGTQRTKDGIEK